MIYSFYSLSVSHFLSLIHASRLQPSTLDRLTDTPPLLPYRHSPTATDHCPPRSHHTSDLTVYSLHSCANLNLTRHSIVDTLSPSCGLTSQMTQQLPISTTATDHRRLQASPHKSQPSPAPPSVVRDSITELWISIASVPLPSGLVGSCNHKQAFSLLYFFLIKEKKCMCF